MQPLEEETQKQIGGKLYDLKSSLLAFEIWLFFCSFSLSLSSSGWFLTPFGFFLPSKSQPKPQKEWKPENVIVWIILAEEVIYSRLPTLLRALNRV